MSGPDIRVGRYGLRTFTIDRRRRQLRPLAVHRSSLTRDAWRGGTCIAVCVRCQTHTVPHDDCTCGIYATNYVAALPGYGFPPIIAVIAAEGDTIVGADGFRTSAARVVGYWLSPTLPQRLSDIVREECADATEFDDLDAMIGHYHLRYTAPPPTASESGATPTARDRLSATLQQIGRLLQVSTSGQRLTRSAMLVTALCIAAMFTAQINENAAMRLPKADDNHATTLDQALTAALAAWDRLLYEVIAATPALIIGLTMLLGVIATTVTVTAVLHPPARADAPRAALAVSATVWVYVLAAATTYACTRGWALHPVILAAVGATAAAALLATLGAIGAVRNHPRDQKRDK